MISRQNVILLIQVGLNLSIIGWAFAIYGNNQGVYPNCDKQLLEKWFLIYGCTALALQLIAFVLMGIASYVASAALLAAGKQDEVEKVQEELLAVTKWLNALNCLVTLATLFLFSWWITGNVWIWNSNSALCGRLSEDGKKWIILTYCAPAVACILACFKGQESLPEEEEEGLPEGTYTPSAKNAPLVEV